MRFIFALLLVAVASPVSADVILRDTISDGGFNTTGQAGVLNISGGSGPNALLQDASVGISFVGNGQAILDVEVIWQHAGAAGFNTGNYQPLNWRLALFLNPAEFTNEGALGRSGAIAPDYTLTLSDPSNPDYDTVVGNAGEANNHLARFDLSGLGWMTEDGQHHVLTVVPVLTVAGQDVIAGVAYSPTSTSPLDLYDVAADNGTPAETFAQRGLPYDNVAARITAAVPEPSSLLLITLSLPAFLRRRR